MAGRVWKRWRLIVTSNNNFDRTNTIIMKRGIGSLLKEIQSEQAIETIYIRISEKAGEWMVAGFIEEANKLLEGLWSYHIPHSADLWLSDEGFQVIWSVSGIQPPTIPFLFK